MEEVEGLFKADALSEVDAEEGAANKVASKGMQGECRRELEVVSALSFPCLYKYDGMFFLIFKLLKT